MSEDRLASEIGIFFLAGFETTGHSGAWLLYLVSQHPEVEAKICAELDQQGLLKSADRPNPRQVTYDDLGKLTYLDMAIKVWMRYPSLTRMALELVVLKDEPQARAPFDESQYRDVATRD